MPDRLCRLSFGGKRNRQKDSSGFDCPRQRRRVVFGGKGGENATLVCTCNLRRAVRKTRESGRARKKTGPVSSLEEFLCADNRCRGRLPVSEDPVCIADSSRYSAFGAITRNEFNVTNNRLIFRPIRREKTVRINLNSFGQGRVTP